MQSKQNRGGENVRVSPEEAEKIRRDLSAFGSAAYWVEDGWIKHIPLNEVHLKDDPSTVIHNFSVSLH